MRTAVGLLLGLLALPACAHDIVQAADKFLDLKALLGFLGGVVAALVSIWVARRARLGGLDQTVHQRRVDLYPRLVACGSRLAVYFPRPTTNQQPLAPQDCAEMGRSMSRWYFGGGGLLLSAKARDAYFSFMRALTRASLAGTLRVPTRPEDPQLVSVASLKIYWRDIEAEGSGDVETWTFGIDASASDPPAVRFRDYVLLQRLSSKMRTALAGDIRGRRRPA